MTYLITGGAGFIGCHAAKRFMDDGQEVVILDNLSRPGSDLNLAWLRAQGDLTFFPYDVADVTALREVFGQCDIDVVLHLAGQVAVTTSISEPRGDFESNVLGTFNVLEAIREFSPQAVLVYASTNKVYGSLPEVHLVETAGRYECPSLPRGVPETMPLDFYTPYGCSKGAADQYVRDYTRIYDLRAVVMRQSCIYGDRQFGVEDQGWLAWFVIAALLGYPITIFGDGKQVRDVLCVDDLLDAYEAAIERIDLVAGQVYNVGGGGEMSLSLLELVTLLEGELDTKIDCHYADWRPGDQLFYVSDISRARKELGWSPRVNLKAGITGLIGWIEDNRDLVAGFYNGRI
jgi:CDP-paratose 2-epimerase